MEYERDHINLTYKNTDNKMEYFFNQFRMLLRRHKNKHRVLKKIVRKHVGDEKFNEIMSDYNKEIQKKR